MTKRSDITPELCRQLLRYESETGKLFWRERDLELCGSARLQKSWNTKFAGKEAFISLSMRGYKQGQIFGLPFKAHRVAYAIYHGKWPDGEIDHINGDESDNRITNLRDVTASVNGRNKRRPKNNTSGVSGVHFVKKEKRWRAVAGFWYSGSHVYLGQFKTKEEAIAARLEYNAKSGYTKRHGINEF